MNLKDYIKKVLADAPYGSEIFFEINLNPDVTVSESETGNKVSFTVVKTYQTSN